MTRQTPHPFYSKLRDHVAMGASTLVDEALKASQALLSSLPVVKLNTSSINKVLLCRHFYTRTSLLTNNYLISEEKFVLDDTLSEFANSNLEYSFDQYFWDLEYNPFKSASNHFISYVLSRNYNVIMGPIAKVFLAPIL